MVVRAMHEVVSRGVFVEVFALGQRVLLHDPALELVVGGDKPTPPPCMGTLVPIGALIKLRPLEIGGFAMLAE